jgi:hypothetical protein
MTRKWKAFKSAPRDGKCIDVLCRSRDGGEVEVKKLRFISSRSKGLELRGEMNILSPYLKPSKWDTHQP